MRLKGRIIGLGLSGSHCTYDEVIPHIDVLQREGAQVLAVVSFAASQTTTRFTTGEALVHRLREATGFEPIVDMLGAEPLGQQKTLDAFVVAPCTGNTLAKLANAINDSPVLMAAKGTLRNLRPVVLAISTNDALGANALNVARLLQRKHVYFVPFGQDNPQEKPTSAVADMNLLADTVVEALAGRQLQPVLIQRELRPVR